MEQIKQTDHLNQGVAFIMHKQAPDNKNPLNHSEEQKQYEGYQK